MSTVFYYVLCVIAGVVAGIAAAKLPGVAWAVFAAIMMFSVCCIVADRPKK